MKPIALKFHLVIISRSKALTASLFDLRKEDGSINPEAYKVYIHFMKKLEKALLADGYEIVDQGPSKYKELGSVSYYVTIRPKIINPKQNIQLIFFTKFSDHGWSESTESKRRIYHDNKALEFAWPTGKKRQGWTEIFIQINKKTYRNFQDVIDDVFKEIHEAEESL